MLFNWLFLGLLVVVLTHPNALGGHQLVYEGAEQLGGGLSHTLRELDVSTEN